MNPRKLEHGFRMSSAGIPYTYLKGMRITMFQLSGFCVTLKAVLSVFSTTTGLQGRATAGKGSLSWGRGSRNEP